MPVACPNDHSGHPTSGEVESFIAAITSLFWGHSWEDVKALARVTWIDSNRSGIEWEAVSLTKPLD